MSPKAEAVIANLKAQANPANVAGMARYGISTEGTLGVPVHALRQLAKQVGRGGIRENHELAAELWASGIHEARILATIVDDPALVTRSQMNRWARDFDSWDVCDQACQNLFRHTPFAFEKAAEWARARPEFVRRAGFALMAGLAVNSAVKAGVKAAVKAAVTAKDAPDAAFEAFLPLIAEAATDDRNMVKKAVNWALRAIGKRNPRLRRQAVAAAGEIGKMDSRAARWIASDALRELQLPPLSRPRAGAN